MSDISLSVNTVAEQVRALVVANGNGDAAAVAELDKLITTCQQQLGAYHIATLTARIGRGAVAFQSGDAAAATREYVQVRSRLRAAYYSEHPLFVELYANMAAVYAEQELHLESQAMIESALAISETVYGLASMPSAMLMMRLGDALREREEFNPAQVQYANALGIFKELDSPEHLNVSLKMGALFFEQNRYDQAAAILEEVESAPEFTDLKLEKVLEVYTMLRDACNLSDAISRSALYELKRIRLLREQRPPSPEEELQMYRSFLSYFELAEIPDVREQVCQEFLAVAEKTAGTETEPWAEAQQILGECYCLGKKFDIARPHLELALKFFSQPEHENQARRAEVLKTLGSIELYLQNPAEARMYLSDAIQFFADSTSGSWAHAQALHALALAEKMSGQQEKAVGYLERIVELGTDVDELRFMVEQARQELRQMQSPDKIGKDSPGSLEAEQRMNSVGALFNQALQLQSQQQHSRALKIFEEILSIVEAAQGATHPNLAPILEHISHTHAELGNSELSASFLQRAKDLSD